MKNRSSLTCLFILLIIGIAGHASAQGRDFEGLLNRLLAPGPLMKGHESLEHKDCLKCHEPAGGIPNRNCLDCHTDIDRAVKAQQGFHGLMNNQPCIECHADHKGREYDSTKVDEKSFDHSATGFLLEGGHSKPTCKDCHTNKRSQKVIRPNETRFFGTSSSCISCHAKDDVHFFKGKFAKVECSECHNINAWKPAEAFNHGRETGYDLLGKHARISCNNCHAPRGPGSVKYEFPELKTRKCLTCHEDHHGNRLSPRFRDGSCDQCHNQEAWRLPQFNHSVTSFTLRGRHSQVSCAECHKQSPAVASRGRPFFNWAGLNQACASCHADYHGYQNQQGSRIGKLSECQTCHTELGWKNSITFNHDTQTRFPITGKHRQNQCFDCHIPNQQKVRGVKARPAPTNIPRSYQFPELMKKTCETCHKSPHSDSFHRRFRGAPCSSCHTPDGWNIMVSGQGGILGGDRSFHDKTRFPLTGRHLQQSCGSCHVKNGKETYRFPNASKGFCINCHNNVHRNQFSKKTQTRSCGDCHTTTSFDKRLPFNHEETAFPLTGSHKRIAARCQECHKPSRMTLPTNPPKRANQYRFPGREKGFCENCHTSVHKGQFRRETVAKSCASCHSTTTFGKLLPFNHDMTRFKLTGRHAQFKDRCTDCHKPSDKKLPTNPPKTAHQFVFPNADKGFCVNCHTNQHRDMFRPKFFNKPCFECHTTINFSRLKRFNHRQTAFPIRGKHRQVSCKECHEPTRKRFSTKPFKRKGQFIFPNLARQNCQTCHIDVHQGSRGTECTKCHTEAGWEFADRFHRDFTLKGVHLNIACDQCHVNDRKLRGSSEECRTCHQHEDPHQGMLPQCGDCHTQTFWENPRFNHNLTLFPLVGAHRLTDCRSCHQQGVYQGLPSDCVGCHLQDALQVVTPNHNSPRYQSCDQCHNQFIFK
ncbi:MAG: hypothetical protein ACOH5I_07740 [Oligoflexus sp.]